MVVQGAATFAEMLDAELHCTTAPPGSNAWNRPLTTPLFVFEPPPTRKIVLTGLERRALMALKDLGATDLDENLSVATLRRAFRRLARRYHPDSYPGSDSGEQQRLARVFVEVTEHYRVLAAAIQKIERTTAC